MCHRCLAPLQQQPRLLKFARQIQLNNVFAVAATTEAVTMPPQTWVTGVAIAAAAQPLKHQPPKHQPLHTCKT